MVWDSISQNYSEKISVLVVESFISADSIMFVSITIFISRPSFFAIFESIFLAN
jgi:hypothetical protein